MNEGETFNDIVKNMRNAKPFSGWPRRQFPVILLTPLIPDTLSSPLPLDQIGQGEGTALHVDSVIR